MATTHFSSAVSHPIDFSLNGRSVLWTAELREFAHGCLSKTTRRFGRRIRGISIWLEDLNGPRGGIEKRCRIELLLKPKGRVVANASASDSFSAIRRALVRAQAVFVRKLKQSHRMQQLRKPLSRSGLSSVASRFATALDHQEV